MTSTERWLEAIFIKKISTNIFQISLGSHLISAHKGQNRLVRHDERQRRVALRKEEEPEARRGTKRRRLESEDEPPFLGFPAPPPLKNEIHPRVLNSDFPSSKRIATTDPMSTQSELRRSSRIRKKKNDDMFVFSK